MLASNRHLARIFFAISAMSIMLTLAGGFVDGLHWAQLVGWGLFIVSFLIAIYFVPKNR